jgi:hypothetical protein
MTHSARRLLHGSHAQLAPGHTILPAHALGLPPRLKTPNQPRYSPLWVYVTERADYAACFGTVYEVEPIGTLVRDPDAKWAWRCRRARVIGRHSASPSATSPVQPAAGAARSGEQTT